jgi:DNA-binding NarL/FixJ family response regulator
VVIALTADVMDDRRRLILASDADDFLSKPCPESELLEKLRTHLRLVYIYDDEEAAVAPPSEGNPGPIEPDLDSLRKLPPALVKELRAATRSGNKALLDELIAAVAETGGAQSAGFLRHLADGYEYDNLVHFLELACRP